MQGAVFSALISSTKSCIDISRSTPRQKYDDATFSKAHSWRQVNVYLGPVFRSQPLDNIETYTFG